MHRSRQHDVVAVVVRDPVHFPRAKQHDARGAHLRVGQRQFARGLFQHDLAHVGGVDRNPAIAGGVELGAAVLGFRDVAGLAQALVAQLGIGHAQAIGVACGDAGGAGQGHEQRVDVGAFAVQVVRRQHVAHIAHAAAAGRGRPAGVFHHPFVDGAGARQVALVAAGDLVRGGLDDAVGGQQCGGFQEFAQRGGAFKHGVRGRRLRQVDPAIARLEAAGHGDVARGLGIGPLHGQHLHVVAGRPHQLGGAAAADLPGALRAALVRRVGGVRHRHPDARVRAGVFHADVGGQRLWRRTMRRRVGESGGDP
ncbi:hypothetical protein G6F65_017659 [Rhizopus arrhizus]|nr:hypothetical protein G6F65_017659 [Rhizopus arrhizus]